MLYFVWTGCRALRASCLYYTVSVSDSMLPCSGRLRAFRSLQEPLPQYRDVDGRDVPWQQSAAGTDTALLRFLVAC